MRTIKWIMIMVCLTAWFAAGAGCKKADKPTASTAPGRTSTSGAKAQTLCPVMGNPINKEIYVDYQGKRVYFCCADCKAKFDSDPEKYMKQMKDQGIQPEATPK